MKIEVGVEHTWSYHYDLAGRLERTELDGQPYEQLAYDANSNRISRTDSVGQTITADYDDQDRLLRYGDATFTYTANGEMLTKTDSSGTTTYTYDVFGNLTDVSLPDGRHIHYIIDGRNRRVGKAVDGTVEYYLVYADQINPIAQLDAAGNVVAQFVYGTRMNVPDYLLKDGRRYRVLADHLGSVRLVVDDVTGEVVQRIDYDPWGVVLTDTNPGFQPFYFAGGVYDIDTGLVRFGARDYLPEHGIWSARDALPAFVGVGNHYDYVVKDPPNHNDPEGLQGPCGGGPSLPQTTGDWFMANIYNDGSQYGDYEGWKKRRGSFMRYLCNIGGLSTGLLGLVSKYNVMWSIISLSIGVTCWAYDLSEDYNSK